jgi:hypothetical protein
VAVTLGDRLPELDPARERQIAVVLVPADGLVGGFDRPGRRREISVQVLEPQNTGVITGGLGDPVDREAGNALQSSRDEPGAQAEAPDEAS